MLARDTADGRLGFLFSRPLPWGTIWGGKWLAALVLVVRQRASCSRFPGWPRTRFRRSAATTATPGCWAMLDGPGVGLGFLLIVVVVGLANFGATAFRSRSTWLALDLVLMLAAIWATRRYVAPLWFYGIVGAGDWTLPLALLPLALALVVGSLAQVAVGRTDLRRAHRALSLGFWAVIGLTLAVAAGYWLWVRSAGPDQVSVHRRDARCRGTLGLRRRPRAAERWLPARVPDRHHDRPLPLTSRARGRARPLRGVRRAVLGGRPVRRAAGRRHAAAPALTLFDLREAAPRVTQVALESSPPPTWKTSFALSPSAATVFVAHESGASLFELPSGRRVATTTIPPGWRPAVARYLAEGSARAWLVPADDGPARTQRGPRCASSTWRPTERRARRRSRSMRRSTRSWGGAKSSPTRKAGGSSRRWRASSLRDGSTGAPLARLVEGTGNSPGFLPRGRPHRGRGPRRRGPAAVRAPPCVGVRPGGREARQTSSSRCAARQPRPRARGRSRPRRRVVLSRVFLSGDAVVVDVASGAIVEKLLPGSGPRFGFPRAPRRQPSERDRACTSSATMPSWVPRRRSVAWTAWSGSTSRPASGRSWPDTAPPAASGSARAERLEHHVEGAAGSLGEERR